MDYLSYGSELRSPPILSEDSQNHIVDEKTKNLRGKTETIFSWIEAHQFESGLLLRPPQTTGATIETQ